MFRIFFLFSFFFLTLFLLKVVNIRRKILFLYPNGGRQTNGMLYYDSIKLLHTDGNDVILAKKYSVTQKIKKIGNDVNL